MNELMGRGGGEGVRVFRFKLFFLFCFSFFLVFNRKKVMLSFIFSIYKWHRGRCVRESHIQSLLDAVVHSRLDHHVRLRTPIILSA